MSRYASKRELEDVIRRTIETDHNDTGLPTDCAAYNMAGVFRALDIMGDPTFGYTTRQAGRETFVQALRDNLRPAYAESGEIRPGTLVGLAFALVPATLLLTFSARLAGMLAGTVGGVA